MVKFSDMPYERADLEAAGRELKALAKALCDAKSGEEQFEIHQKYYALKKPDRNNGYTGSDQA